MVDAFLTKRDGADAQGRQGLVVAITILAALTVGAVLFFRPGITALLQAWSTPEYSHGPLIPLLSGLLFLRELRRLPEVKGPVNDRLPGVAALGLALLLGLAGRIAGIADIVAYALIAFVGGVILISFGFRRGILFWPAVLHLAFMLPLPATLYWKVSTSLQLFSSEVGVALIRAAGIPVYLDGNIIDLGIYKLHVAEACSGLRYLYPILSFSYIFAALYRGPVWHKAVLLISAAPITVVMNSVRIGIIGVIVNSYGLEHVEGITHLLEGWVIFLTSVLILFGLVQAMLWLQPAPMSLSESLDIDFSGLGEQLARVGNMRLSLAMAAAIVMTVGAALAWNLAPERGQPEIRRHALATFPSAVGDWRRESLNTLEPEIERALRADDYLSASYAAAGASAAVDVFVAWYADQSSGGIHSPEVCLPGGGWEMADIRQIDIAPRLDLPGAFNINRAIIQRGESRLLVYYWFEQYGGRTASDLVAKVEVLRNGLLYNRTDGALLRLITPIAPGETVGSAEARLLAMTGPMIEMLPRFVPTRETES